MTQKEGELIKIGDILFHTIFKSNIVVTKIITEEDILEGWIGDFQYRFEDESKPNDTESFNYVNLMCKI